MLSRLTLSDLQKDLVVAPYLLKSYNYKRIGNYLHWGIMMRKIIDVHMKCICVKAADSVFRKNSTTQKNYKKLDKCVGWSVASLKKL